MYFLYIIVLIFSRYIFFFVKIITFFIIKYTVYKDKIITSALGSLRQVDHEFKGSLGYIARSCLDDMCTVFM